MSNEFKLVPVESILSIADRIKFNCPKAAVELEQIIAAAPQPPALGGEPDTLAVVTLGCFSSEELGDIDIEPQMVALERIQQELVRSDSDEHIELIDRAHLAQPDDQQGASLAIPDECPHMIVFDDADRDNLIFAGSGARQAALKTFDQISGSWNAHLFVRVARNSRDDRYPSASVVADQQGEPVAYVPESAFKVLQDVGWVHAFKEAGNGGKVVALYLHAQPATAKVDENAEFEVWRTEQIESLKRMGYPDAARAFRNLGSVHWAAWQARARLNGGQS